MPSRVYIGRLNRRATERDIEKFFKNYGRISEVMLKNGFGFVDFEEYRDADDAVYELHGRDLLGERVIVEHAKGPSGRSQRSSRAPKPTWLDNSRYGAPVRTGYKLIVENLSSRVSWQDLKDYMRQAGDVTFADAHKDRRNEGVVEFASYKDMKRAIDKLDGTEINGRKIKLIEDSRNKSRSRSRSDSRRSRSRGRHSRSHSRSVSRGRSNSRRNDRKRSESKKREDDRSVSRNRDSRDRRSHSKDRRGRSTNRRDRSSRSKSHSRNRNDSRDRSRSVDSRHKNDGDKKRSRSGSDRSRSVSKRSQKQKDRSQSKDRLSKERGGSKREDNIVLKERSDSVDRHHDEVKDRSRSRSHSRSSSRSCHSDNDKAGSHTPDIRKRSRSPESTGTSPKRQRLNSNDIARRRRSGSESD